MRPHTKNLLHEIEWAHDEAHANTAVGPSDYLTCPKQLQLRHEGAPVDAPIVDNHAAIIGTMIHAAFALHLTQNYGPDQVAVEYPILIPGLDRPGTADAVWWDAGVVVDLKTCSSRAFDRVVTHGASEAHVGQVSAYALGLNRAGTRNRITTCVLAYVNRENGDVHEVEWEYDSFHGIDVVDWLVRAQDGLDAGLDMERWGDGPETGYPCDYCPFWRTCWDVENTPEDRSHASKFTTDDEVEGLIDVYLDAGEVEREAKAAKAAARARLFGISYAGNGRRLSWTRPRAETVSEVDVEGLTAVAVAAGLTVPMVDTVKTTAARIAVKRSTEPKGATE